MACHTETTIGLVCTLIPEQDKEELLIAYRFLIYIRIIAKKKCKWTFNIKCFCLSPGCSVVFIGNKHYLICLLYIKKDGVMNKGPNENNNGNSNLVVEKFKKLLCFIEFCICIKKMFRIVILMKKRGHISFYRELSIRLPDKFQPLSGSSTIIIFFFIDFCTLNTNPVRQN